MPGRVVYYNSIPSSITVNSTTGVIASGSTNEQCFWKDYIDYVLGSGRWTAADGLYGVSSANKNTGAGSTLYYNSAANSNLPPQITARSSLPSTNTPYMKYTDTPIHPRAHFWFGPLTMLTYLQQPGNWFPGTCYEAQCWQLKVGINSALIDIQNNHPNDLASMIFFSDSNGYSTARVAMSKNFQTMQNSLFYPYSILSTLSNANSTIRPYSLTSGSTSNPAGLNDASDTIIPNAGSGTCPMMAFMAAYNQFGNATDTSVSPHVTYAGRQSASKIVIFETDGCPHCTCSGTLTGSGAAGNWYYATIGSSASQATSTSLSAPSKTDACTIVQQLVASTTASTPGYSTSRNPAYVHAIAFGDLFESTSTSTLTPSAFSFCAAVQMYGNTSQNPTGAAASAPGTMAAWYVDPLDYTDYYVNVEPWKIVTGSYTTRIANIGTAMQRIMQGGVQIALIQ